MRSKLSSFSLYGQWFPRYWAIFKIFIFGHEFQKLHIYSLSTSTSWNWAYLCSPGNSFRIRADFQNAIFGHETWQVAEVPEVAYMYMLSLSLSTRRGRNWAYFHSMDTGFQDMGQLSNLLYLGMKLGKWPKFQKLHIYSLSTSEGRNWAYFHSMGSGFQDTSGFSKLPYLGMKPGHWPKFQKLHIHFLPQGVEIELIFTLWAAVSEIRVDFQTCYIWAWNLASGQSSRSCTYTS